MAWALSGTSLLVIVAGYMLLLKRQADYKPGMGGLIRRRYATPREPRSPRTLTGSVRALLLFAGSASIIDGPSFRITDGIAFLVEAVIVPSTLTTSPSVIPQLNVTIDLSWGYNDNDLPTAKGGEGRRDEREGSRLRFVMPAVGGANDRFVSTTSQQGISSTSHWLGDVLVCQKMNCQQISRLPVLVTGEDGLFSRQLYQGVKITLTRATYFYVILPHPAAQIAGYLHTLHAEKDNTPNPPPGMYRSISSEEERVIRGRRGLKK
ncbi:uncharacterized protein THITE_2132777 [Thermothielavioides terrestris NRRL 8126]|uniref:Uncharacterized protein n=1 Tax=Thermothielavioides terrestris (strain ATCC 38088 / NRRL 8126) TaxID=578455 RepID=G2RHX4_THETT|nr:uncharacterized protein THITE_2132777 [Thermothielavioides terrestris NRRL 8126]AEO71436.1 hypothetical protein THITE_2132777 [Thermothielavioides terrestris NRRL 8126]